MVNRVVVTGVGCISAVGHSLGAVWAAAVEGRTGIRPITVMDATDYDVHIAAEISDWDPEQFMEPRLAKRFDRFTQFAIAAADQAVADAALAITEDNCYDVGVVMGSGIGGMGTWETQHKVLLERGPSRLSPFLVPMLIVDMASGMVSMRLGAKGPNYTAVSACASSTHCIGDAFEIIKRGTAVAMVAGGTEAGITTTGLGGFCSAKALSTRNEPLLSCRPFDKARDGFVMGEGATAVVLEELGHAVTRGARIYGEVVGFGMTGDAYNMVAPDPTGIPAARAMQMALREAELSPADIDYVNAHAPGTPGGDDMEARALQNIYTRDYTPMVNSTKPIHGHQLGATGATEFALSLMSMKHGLVTRTVNCDDVDDDLWVDIVRGENRQARVDVVMSNNFGFGGHNAVLIARKFDE